MLRGNDGQHVKEIAVGSGVCLSFSAGLRFAICFVSASCFGQGGSDVMPMPVVVVPCLHFPARSSLFR